MKIICLTLAMLFLLPCLASAAAEPEKNATPDILSRYRPVVVTTISEQTLSNELTNKIIKALSKTLQRGLMSSVARAQYAKGPSFPTSKKKRGPVSGIIYAISETDDFFDAEMSGDLGAAIQANQHHGRLNLMFEAFLSDDLNDFKTSLETQVVPPNLALMWEVAKSTALESLPVGPAVMMNRALTMPIVNANDPRVTGLYRAGARIYDGIHQGDGRSQFVPLYMRLQLVVDGENVSLFFQTTIKPGNFVNEGPFQQNEPVLPLNVRMSASLAPVGTRPLMQVRMQRRWGPNVALPRTMAIVTFGAMAGDDWRDVKICQDNCVANLDFVPVIRLKLQPSVLLPKERMSSDAQTFWPIYWEQLKRAYGFDLATKKLRELVIKMDAYQQKYVTLNIMINQLVIDLKADAGMAIVPQLSSTPVLVQLRSGGGSTAIRDDYLVLSRVATDETRPFLEPWTQAATFNPMEALLTRYTASKILQLRNQLVFRLYEQTLGPEIAKSLSGEVRNGVAAGIAEVDRGAGQAVDNLMQVVVNLLR